MIHRSPKMVLCVPQPRGALPRPSDAVPNREVPRGHEIQKPGMGTCIRRMKRLGGTDARRKAKEDGGLRGRVEIRSVRSVQEHLSVRILPGARRRLPSQIDEGWDCQICTSYSERTREQAERAAAETRTDRPLSPRRKLILVTRRLTTKGMSRALGLGISCPWPALLARLGCALLLSLSRHRPPRAILMSRMARASLHEGERDAITRLSWPRKLPSDSGAGTALST